jgi:DNA polymerase-3 subunit delta
LDYQKAIDLIESGDILPYYLLHGDEPLLFEAILRPLGTALCPDPALESMLLFSYDAGADDPMLSTADMKSGSFFGERKLCVVKGIDPGAKEGKAWVQALVEYVKSYSPSTVLVATVSEVLPAKHELAAVMEKGGAVVRCTRPKGREVGKWAQVYAARAGKKLAPGAVWALETMAGPSLGVVQSEVDKLVSYVGTRDLIDQKDVEAVCSNTAEIIIWALTDAVMAGKSGAAFSAVQKLMEAGEDISTLLYMVAQNIRQVARVRYMRGVGMTQEETTKSLGVHPFVAQKSYVAAGKIADGAVIDLYEKVVMADEEQKSGHDPLLTLQTLVLDLSRMFSR